MTTKDRVLTLLCACRGSYLSGEELAESLNLSRAAVWKAISALRAGGYPIEGQPSRGYRLLPGGDILSLGGIESRLDSREVWKIEVLDQVTSTNALLKARADQGAPEGTVLVAASQTLGRGRLGRKFYSPADTGVYLSALLRRDWPPAAAFPPEIAGIAGSVYEARREDGRNALAAAFLNGLRGALAEPQAALRDYRRRCLVLGKDILVQSPQGSRPARALDLDEQCGLIVQYPDGSREVLRSGEISVRPVGSTSI